MSSYHVKYNCLLSFVLESWTFNPVPRRFFPYVGETLFIWERFKCVLRASKAQQCNYTTFAAEAGKTSFNARLIHVLTHACINITRACFNFNHLDNCQDLCYDILTRKYSFLILLLLMFFICVPFQIQGDCFTLFFFSICKA